MSVAACSPLHPRQRRLRPAARRAQRRALRRHVLPPTGTNPFVDTDEDRLSTFALDVDTASYTLARRYLSAARCRRPRRAGRGVRQLLRATTTRRRDAATSRSCAEGAPSPFADGERYRLLRFGVKAREIAAATASPAASPSWSTSRARWTRRTGSGW